MASNVYECMFLLDTNKVAGDVKNADKTIRGIFDRNGIEVLAARPWDERRLAYSIGKHKKGLYFLTYFNAEGTKLANLKRDFVLNEMILRHMILKIHPKMVDTMLTLAKDEHALALQMIRDDSAEEGGYSERRGEGRGEGGHRRHGGGGGRRHAESEDKEG